MSVPEVAKLPTARLWRRLAAGVYDGLLLIAINAIVAAVVVNLLTPKVAVEKHTLTVLSASIRYGLMLPAMLLATGLFFAYFWVHSQQTLGMQTWHIRLERWDQERLSWRDACVRYLWALACLFPAGLGYWWALLDRHGLSLHDRLSRTRVVFAPPLRSKRH